jgi:hypothetical protein
MAPETIDPNARWIDGALWEFRTARYTIALFAEPADMHPAGNFQFEEDIEFASSGDPAHWFCAVMAVYDENGRRIASDVLGGCSYRSFREFYSGHLRPKNGRDCRGRFWKRHTGAQTYFTDMVHEAVANARRTIALAREGA